MSLSIFGDPETIINGAIGGKLLKFDEKMTKSGIKYLNIHCITLLLNAFEKFMNRTQRPGWVHAHIYIEL